MVPRALLFTRYPTPGEVKTRLIPALGAAGAAVLHRRLVERTLGVLRQTGLPLEVWVTGGPAEAFRGWLGPDTAIRAQGGGNLGARMERALAGSAAILVGSDLPLLQSHHVREAAAALAAGEVALGPAEDGGYYLVGLAEPAPFLFGGMAWSTPGVLAQTRARLEAHRRRYRLLETLADLDRPEDLARFEGMLK